MSAIHFLRAGTACILLAMTACSPTRSVNAQSVRPDKDRKAAPDFTLKDANGQPVKLSDFKGKVVLLDFWATWCGPCKIEIPWFIEFERKNKDKGLVVLGVSMDEDGWTSVKPFVKELGINYRIMVSDTKVEEQYGGLDALPTTLLIDRDGKIASVHVGVASKQDFEDAIEKLLQTNAASKRDVFIAPSAYVRTN